MDALQLRFLIAVRRLLKNRREKARQEATRFSASLPCPTCGAPPCNHPHCEGCGLRVGPGHIIAALTTAAGRWVCYRCKQELPMYRSWADFQRGRPRAEKGSSPPLQGPVLLQWGLMLC